MVWENFMYPLLRKVKRDSIREVDITISNPFHLSYKIIVKQTLSVVNIFALFYLLTKRLNFANKKIY